MKKSHANWIKSCKGIGWLFLLEESIDNSKIETYNPDEFTIEDMEKWINKQYSEDNIRDNIIARRERMKEANENVIASYLHYKNKK